MEKLPILEASKKYKKIFFALSYLSKYGTIMAKLFAIEDLTQRC